MISAIFLLLVIAVLGAYLASVATTEHTTAAIDLQGAKAYQAAYAGIQWGAFQVLRNNACASSTFFSLSGGLSGFSVRVDCVQTGYSENGVTTKSMYQLTATGCAPPAAGTCPGTASGYYVERQIQATLDH